MTFVFWYCIIGLVIGFLYLVPTFRRKRPDEDTAAYIWRRREHAQLLTTAGIFCPVLWPLAIIYFLFTRKTDCPVCGGHNTVMFSGSRRYSRHEDNWFRCSECDYIGHASADVPEIKPDRHGSSGRGSSYSSSSSGGSWGGGHSGGGGASRKF